MVFFKSFHKETKACYEEFDFTICVNTLELHVVSMNNLIEKTFEYKEKDRMF